MGWTLLLAAAASFFDLTWVEFLAGLVAVVLLVVLGLIALRPAKSLLAEHTGSTAGAGVGAGEFASRPAEPSSGAFLVGRIGEHAGRAVRVPREGLTLGRDAGGAGYLSFDAKSDVSRRHCRVTYDEGQMRFKVTDLKSSNGTFLMPGNKKLVAQREVVCRAGQLIRLGNDNVFELKAR